MEQPKALKPADVLTLATALSDIGMDHVLSELPSNPQRLKDVVGGIFACFNGDPRPYIVGHFDVLRDFYTATAGDHLAVVVWCD